MNMHTFSYVNIMHELIDERYRFNIIQNLWHCKNEIIEYIFHIPTIDVV